MDFMGVAVKIVTGTLVNVILIMVNRMHHSLFLQKQTMAEESIIPKEVIVNKIYEIRGLRVMLDRDLAELYDVKAIRLREQVKRNEERFPENFMFRLTQDEAETMVSQNAIPSKKHLGGALPYVFTEHGVLQLSNVMRSGRAVQMSIQIIEVFVSMREMLLTHHEIFTQLEDIRKSVSGHDHQIKRIFEHRNQFERSKQQELDQQNRRRIGYRTGGEG